MLLTATARGCRERSLSASARVVGKPDIYPASFLAGFRFDGYGVYQLVNSNEDRATLDATVFAVTLGALMVGDKTYCYHFLLSTTGGTFHDSDMGDTVVFCHPHSDFSRIRTRNDSSADFGNK